MSSNTDTPGALDLARALEPVYATRDTPERLLGLAAEKLSGVLGGPVRLALPDGLELRPSGAEPAGRVWRVEFEHDGGRGNLVGSGTAPLPDLRAALQLELRRLAGYVANLRSIALDLDRLDFRMRALHQISRTLTIARELPDTEAHIVDFTGELFFASWTALYRPRDPATLEPRTMRSPSGHRRLPALPAPELGALLPIGKESEAVPIESGPAWLPEGVQVAATLDIAGERLGCLMLGHRITGQPYEPDDVQLLSTVAHSSAIALSNAELVAALREQTVVDDLTGLFNRRFLERRLHEELERGRRYGRPVALLLMDIDEFKSYNDTYGHGAGDLALSRVGAVIRANTRNVDLACRYGGEEFAVIAPETGRSQAARLAERLHGAIRGLEPVSGLQRRLTVSSGVACFPEDAGEPGGLLQTADQALYRAKAEGRDRMVLAQTG